jgi:hypothetical protein
MRRPILAAAVLLIALTPARAPQAALSDVQIAQACCKVCNKGIPCGNSCIAATSTCRQPPGCACSAGGRK